MGLFFNRSKPDIKVLPKNLDPKFTGAVLQHFPIGAAVQYYPEYKKNIILETVIIGYMANRTLVFSAQDIVSEGEGASARILLKNEKKPAPLNRLSIIIPAHNRGTGHLDYSRKEVLERVGGLALGNHVTMMACVSKGKTPLIQATVGKNARIMEGPFADTPVVVLDVDISTFLLIDQRVQMRLQVHVPAQINLDDGTAHDCIMADFSDRCVRLRGGSDGWPAGVCAGKHLTLTLNMPELGGEIVLRGQIYRVDYNDLVLAIEGVQRDGQCQRLEVIDVLSIKARLLQLPTTTPA